MASSPSQMHNFNTNASPHFFKQEQSKNRDIILQILISLIEPNMFRDPLGLAHGGIKQRLIGEKIDNFRVASAGATLIEASHVPGHVKGVTPGSANYLQLPANLIFYQYVKPLCTNKNGDKVNGYIGNYFCLDSSASPDNLGIYDQVIAPSTGKKIHRQRICIHLKKTPPLTIRSQAKEIVDNFSVPGEEHLAHGGAEQFFIGINLKEMADYLEIIIPPHIPPEEKIKMMNISERSFIPYRKVSEEEFKSMKNNSATLAQNLREEIPPTRTLREILPLVLNAVRLDRCKHAINLLNTVKIDSHDKFLLALLKSCLYATIENIEESRKEQETYRSRHFERENILKNLLIHLCGQLILARTEPTPNLAIKRLQRLLKRINSTRMRENSNLELLNRLKVLTLLELSKQFNRLFASTTPYMVVESDLKGLTMFVQNKIEASQIALDYVESAFKIVIKKNMWSQELVHLHSQHAYAQYKLGENQKALEALIQADQLLNDLITSVQDNYWRAAKDELVLLHLSIKLRSYLILAKIKRENYPEPYRSMQPPITPQKELITLLEQMNKFDHMLFSLMVEKLLAMDSSDYHITGWTEHPSLQFAGADLIKAIRTVIPVNMSPINSALIRLRPDVRSIDLPFLGLEPPCGISNTDCKNFLTALGENTSLKSLTLRKFACRLEDKQGNMILDTTDRLGELLRTLNQAQQKGMKLSYLSYDGARLSKDKQQKKELAMEAACQFIENNTSLIEFFPDLYDWDDEKFFRRFVMALKNHPSLEVLYAGIWEKNPNAGKIVHEVLQDRPKPLKIVLHPNPLREGGNPNARKNNEGLRQLNAIWASKTMPSSEQENQGKENDKEIGAPRPHMRM